MTNPNERALPRVLARQLVDGRRRLEALGISAAKCDELVRLGLADTGRFASLGLSVVRMPPSGRFEGIEPLPSRESALLNAVRQLRGIDVSRVCDAVYALMDAYVALDAYRQPGGE